MNIKLTAGWFYGAVIVILAAWILHSFVEALLAGCTAAVASWPLYRRFASHLPRGMKRGAVSFLFTLLIVVFVLAPMLFAIGAMVNEANALLQEVADKGIPVPLWLESVPLIGPSVADHWQRHFAHSGSLALWAQRTDAGAMLGWAQSAGQFLLRHSFIFLFTILVLFFLYQEGESLARNFRKLLRHHIGERAEGYMDLATRALRASVNSMLLVALFDGVGSAVAYAIAGVSHAGVWAAITGSFSLVPFLGYVAVIAVSVRLAIAGATTAALVSFALGCLVLLCGDKLVRPAVARSGTHLHFVWVLMGCLGGFEVLGLVGLVIGPVAISLTRELWEQRVRDLAGTRLPTTDVSTADLPTARIA
jgi:predicted PurR-regulated permease PerM